MRSSYSSNRSAVMKQVRALEKKGFTIADRFRLPTVKEMKKLSAKEQANVARRAAYYVNKGAAKQVKASAYKVIDGKKRSYSEAVNISRLQKARERRKPIGDKKRKLVPITWYGGEPEGGTGVKKSVSRTQLENELTGNYGDFFTPTEIKAYVDEVFDRGYKGSFLQYVYDAGEEPDAKNIFAEKLGVLQENAPQTAKILQDMFNRQLSYGEALMNQRFSEADEIPDFESYYTDKNGEYHAFNVGNIYKMAKLIKGKPLTAAEMRALQEAMNQDTMD